MQSVRAGTAKPLAGPGQVMTALSVSFGSCGWSWCLDSLAGQTSISTKVGGREGLDWGQKWQAFTLAACWCNEKGEAGESLKQLRTVLGKAGEKGCKILLFSCSFYLASAFSGAAREAMKHILCQCTRAQYMYVRSFMTLGVSLASQVLAAWLHTQWLMCVEPMIMHGESSPPPVNVRFKITELINCEQQRIPWLEGYIYLCWCMVVCFYVILSWIIMHLI